MAEHSNFKNEPRSIGFIGLLACSAGTPNVRDPQGPMRGYLRCFRYRLTDAADRTMVGKGLNMLDGTLDATRNTKDDNANGEWQPLSRFYYQHAS